LEIPLRVRTSCIALAIGAALKKVKPIAVLGDR